MKILMQFLPLPPHLWRCHVTSSP